VRALLFKLNNPEPKAIIGGLDLNLDCPRQNMEMFASPDTDESSIAFLQVKITKTKAVEHKDVSGFALTFRGTLGPVDRDTAMYLIGWFGTQRFVTFTEAEPMLELSAEVKEDDEDDQQPIMPPIFEDDDELEPVSAGVEAAQKATKERKREKGHRYPKAATKKRAAARTH
jgi:hypothetical protein